MNELEVVIQGGKKQFRPGEKIAASARWRLQYVPKVVELRLFWFTRGQGNVDAWIVEAVRLDPPASVGSGEATFLAPGAPYSISGKLFSLIWAVELATDQSGECARVEFLISPSGDEIQLQSPPLLDPVTADKFDDPPGNRQE